MQLAAKLTVGWTDIPRSQFTAIELHNRAVMAPHYEKSLFYQLQTATPHTKILGLDRLFRQTCGGIEPIHQIVSALSSLPTVPSGPHPLLCEIDLFAYTFLAGTHKLDRLLPIAHSTDIELAQIQASCAAAIQTLEDFEHTGSLPEQMSELDAQQYLAIRRIVARPSARDEWRVLARLLISGPSTASNLERELGLNHRVAQQILTLFESIGIFTYWGEEPGSPGAETVFVINKVALPLVLFCLKATMGLDLLSNLSKLVDNFHE
ncbi:MAG: hypothetical protein AAFQ95_13080 [Cyanobacteria bacterium J06621_3]